MFNKNDKIEYSTHDIDLNVNVSNCVFCKVVSGQLPSQLMHSDDDFVIIKDIQPRAPLHYLAIPRAHFATLLHASESDAIVVGKMQKKIAEIKASLQLKDYRLIVNQGKGAGQSVWHYHMHILGGKEFGDF